MLYLLSLVNCEIKDFTQGFSEKIQKEKLAFIKFYSPTCKACTTMKPKFEALDLEPIARKVQLIEVNCQEAHETCAKEGIQGWPNMRLYKNGVFFDRYRNVQNVEAMVDWLEGKTEL
ncbi:Protein_disulfide isomerase PDI5 [Hexamita inflata]|uniref:Protein disulfide isomerase PDI5 n=1 Tax=Hexamita inflata TaxID=28002 RepID=A0AA86V0V8_9EUKA|nr:Protein disulfide isomerase PDI5 [Hexamita inflata]CAI9972071.1 Protein disulfide isomerase PDI5 [Hexamita inflata]